MSSLFGNLSQRNFNSFGQTTQNRSKRGVLSSGKSSDDKNEKTDMSSLIPKAHKTEATLSSAMNKSSLVGKKSVNDDDLTNKWLNGEKISNSVVFKDLKDATKTLDLTWGDEFLQKTNKGIDKTNQKTLEKANELIDQKASLEKEIGDNLTEKEKEEFQKQNSLEGEIAFLTKIKETLGNKKVDPSTGLLGTTKTDTNLKTAEPDKYADKKQFLSKVYNRVQELVADGYSNLEATAMAYVEFNSERAASEQQNNRSQGKTFNA